MIFFKNCAATLAAIQISKDGCGLWPHKSAEFGSKNKSVIDRVLQLTINSGICFYIMCVLGPLMVGPLLLIRISKQICSNFTPDV